MLVPIVLCPAQDHTAAAGFEYELVAGFHRVAAAGKLGLTDVPAVVRDSAGEQADRAVENINRLALRPDEEASAVKAMLEKGLTEDGAAQALGWPKATVTARIKLLELPARARELIGGGIIPLSAVGQLRAIGTVSPPLLDVLVEYLDGDQEGQTWATSQLVSDPGYVLGNALRETRRKAFAAYLHLLPSGAVDELRLGKKAAEQLAEAEKLHKQVSQYAYRPPPIRFTEQDVDDARAAGVLIELERSVPIIFDRPLYRELSKRAITRTVEQLQADAERANTERKQTAKQRTTQHVDLGAALMNGLVVVDPAEDMRVARFYVLCGRPHRTNYADFAAMPMRRPAAAKGKALRGGISRRVACSWREHGDLLPRPIESPARCRPGHPSPAGLPRRYRVAPGAATSVCEVVAARRQAGRARKRWPHCGVCPTAAGRASCSWS